LLTRPVDALPLVADIKTQLQTSSITQLALRILTPIVPGNGSSAEIA